MSIPAQRCARVLVVDDDPEMRDFMELLLQAEAALEVRLCGSGLEALEVAGEWLPDLILLDVQMAGMDGLTTFAKLRAGHGTSQVPVVFVSAGAQGPLGERLIAIGATEILKKPFDPEHFLTRVRGLLGDFEQRSSPAAADSAIADMIPRYVLNRRSDVTRIMDFLSEKDFIRIAHVGHNMKGTGGPYGFPHVSLLGKQIEAAAAKEDESMVLFVTQTLQTYLEHLLDRRAA